MAKSSKLRSVGYYTECLNTGVEYAIREDGAVFSREKYFSGRFYTQTKWTRAKNWEEERTFCGLPDRVPVGFASRGYHMLVETTRLRLPQEEK